MGTTQSCRALTALRGRGLGERRCLGEGGRRACRAPTELQEQDGRNAHHLRGGPGMAANKDGDGKATTSTALSDEVLLHAWNVLNPEGNEKLTRADLQKYTSIFF